MMSYRYIAGRLIQSAVLVYVVVTIAFVLIRLAPGDPVTYLYGGQAVSAKTLDSIRHAWGLDRPLADQYAAYLRNIVHGDLGYSEINQRPVGQVIAESLPNTLALMIPSLTLAALGGILLGTAAARRPSSLLDYTIRTTSLVSYATPPFWLGVIFIVVFAGTLHWLPTQGMSTLGVMEKGAARVADIARHMVLPLGVLAWWYSAPFTRLTRAAVLEESRKYYLLTARMKGLPEATVFYRHALRNALRPVVTVLGLQLGTTFAGVVLTETVFAWPGVGRVLFTAVLEHDYPVVLGIFIAVGVAVVLANLAVDLVYLLIDPRLRYA